MIPYEKEENYRKKEKEFSDETTEEILLDIAKYGSCRFEKDFGQCKFNHNIGCQYYRGKGICDFTKI